MWEGGGCALQDIKNVIGLRIDEKVANHWFTTYSGRGVVLRHTLVGAQFNDTLHPTACAFSGHPLTRGDWKCWWAIGRPFNGRPPDEWK